MRSTRKKIELNARSIETKRRASDSKLEVEIKERNRMTTEKYREKKRLERLASQVIDNKRQKKGKQNDTGLNNAEQAQKSFINQDSTCNIENIKVTQLKKKVKRLQ